MSKGKIDIIGGSLVVAFLIFLCTLILYHDHRVYLDMIGVRYPSYGFIGLSIFITGLIFAMTILMCIKLFDFIKNEYGEVKTLT